MPSIASIQDLAAFRTAVLEKRDSNQSLVIVCGGTGCRANGSLQLAEALARELAARGQDTRVELKLSGCHGFCQQGPVVIIEPQCIFYRKVGLDNLDKDVRDIVRDTVIAGKPVERLLHREDEDAAPVERYSDIPFYARQVRVVLKNNGKIDPKSIEDYVAAGGYVALAKAINSDPVDVIKSISDSGLRGRGGGGFPTGKKWQFCRAAHDRSMRYIICNADEGDPGAFMDRSIMEGDPFSVLEGMTIGAYAISNGLCPAEGYIYIRAEYPLAVENVRHAISVAEDMGMLGDNILGSGFNFHIRIKEGAGAFVCGEETALIASVEGKRGMPRPRPPFPANCGLFNKPSNINNVETWVNVTRIIDRGSEWYAGLGTPTSTGTKVFSLVGKVKYSGLVEVPMGIPIQDIVFGIGGGIPDDKRIKAVQTGGPSGGCIPASMLDTPVDYEKLAEAGAIMGSGGLVVMDEDTCMVDIARYFLDFTQNESCGKCVPCRIGTRQLLQILEDIASGKGSIRDIELLEQVAESVKLGSLCGLGQTAPNPVLTTLRYFRNEYERHIRDGKCDAVVCRGLVKAPCRHTCPAGIDVPRYVRFIAAGQFANALKVIREKIPFPSVCGYVCFHPCEKRCRRKEIDDPLAVRALKRFVAEFGRQPDAENVALRRPDTGKRAAIVGSGPAGLTAAYYLGRLGHNVTVFDRDPQPGGTLRTGIPDFRLPRKVIDDEIQSLTRSAGVTIATNTSVASVDELTSQGFHAVLLAFGSQKGLTMGIDGEDEDGVLDCLTFLKAINSGDALKIGKRVAVIGGGSSATDAARCALRHGATDVSILYRRTRAEMPAAEEEVRESIEEGVTISQLVAPIAIRKTRQGLVMQCVRMELGSVDASGRRRPVPIDGSEFDIAADTIVMAVSQSPDDMPDLGCDVDRRGRVAVDETSLQSSRAGVFAAGDAVTGPSSVIEAIATGRRSAQSIDRYLGGDGNIDEVFAPAEEPYLAPLPEDAEPQPRSPVRKRAVAERLVDGGDIEFTYREAEAMAEAMRCLRCDLEEELDDT